LHDNQIELQNYQTESVKWTKIHRHGRCAAQKL